MAVYISWSCVVLLSPHLIRCPSPLWNCALQAWSSACGIGLLVSGFMNCSLYYRTPPPRPNGVLVQMIKIRLSQDTLLLSAENVS